MGEYVPTIMIDVAASSSRSADVSVAGRSRLSQRCVKMDGVSSGGGLRAKMLSISTWIFCWDSRRSRRPGGIIRLLMFDGNFSMISRI